MSEVNRSEIERAFEAQQCHQRRTMRLETSAEPRRERLRRLRDAIVANADAARQALHDDLRKPTEEAMHEVDAALEDIDEAIEHLHEWMRPVEVEPSPQFEGAQARIVYEPRGVCLLFAPWNFPFLLLFQPLVPVLAAGNCAIVRPNEMAPATSRVSARIIRDAFPEHEVAAFEGGVELANELLEFPFDHIFLTGSTNVGRIVMQAAAKHLASVTLELGGKCPAIVDGTADLPAAAMNIGAGRCYNAGQVCLCPDIAWVPEDRRDAFVEQLREFLAATYYPDGELDRSAYSRIVDERNFRRVKGHLDDALERGAQLAFGGDTDATDLTVHPAVLTDVPEEASVMREEIFGPILPVATYRDPQEIADFINATGKPLASYLFSSDRDFVDDIVRRAPSGGVTVNGWAMHWFERRLPFGGVNQSGIGRYHGIHGFRELSHERALLIAPEAVGG